MSDESFLRVVEGEKTVPMTKEEVRALSLCKLGLTEDAVVYDVGDRYRINCSGVRKMQSGDSCVRH